MKIVKFTAMAAIAAMMAAGPASAEDNDWSWQMWGQGRGPGSGWMTGGMMGPGMMNRFGVIDSNDDGIISADEAASQVQTVFAAMDADDDGALTEDEYMSVRMGGGPGYNTERQKVMQAGKKERFTAMDTDKDGKVSQAEFIAGGEKRFADADANKDGKVTPWEFRAQRWH